MAKSYQIIQERYADNDDEPTQDDYPILFASLEEARARAALNGPDCLFEYKGHTYWIAELEPYRAGVTYTGRQFPL